MAAVARGVDHDVWRLGGGGALENGLELAKAVVVFLEGQVVDEQDEPQRVAGQLAHDRRQQIELVLLQLQQAHAIGKEAVGHGFHRGGLARAGIAAEQYVGGRAPLDERARVVDDLLPLALIAHERVERDRVGVFDGGDAPVLQAEHAVARVHAVAARADGLGLRVIGGYKVSRRVGNPCQRGRRYARVGGQHRRVEPRKRLKQPKLPLHALRHDGGRRVARGERADVGIVVGQRRVEQVGAQIAAARIQRRGKRGVARHARLGRPGLPQKCGKRRKHRPFGHAAKDDHAGQVARERGRVKSRTHSCSKMASVMAAVVCGVMPGPAMSAVRRPASSTAATARSIASASFAQSSE